jgi:hypothetical protein
MRSSGLYGIWRYARYPAGGLRGNQLPIIPDALADDGELLVTPMFISAVRLERVDESK